MSLLRERLLRHKRDDAAGRRQEEKTEGEAPAGAAAAGAEGSVRAASAGTASGPGGPAENDEWAVVGASMMHIEAGAFVMRRRTYEPGFRHGHYVLASLQGKGAGLKPLLLTGLPESLTSEEDSFHEKLLFLDTETTGLGLGAGNVPFMIGVGYFEGGRYTVEQMLIRHPGEEAAMLAYLQVLLERHPLLISYNGKSFDWPILKSRYIMNRVKLEREPEGHIDFLYPSRSLWKHTLPSCRLGKVEEERLGVHREDDVPGSLAPTLYFQYLAERKPEVLKGVFLHNELDVLSLAGLAVHFAAVTEGSVDWERIREAGSEEWFRLGLWLDKVGLHSMAEEAMDRLLQMVTQGTVDTGEEAGEPEAAADGFGPEAGCLLPLAQYFKQRGRYAEACRLWQQYIADRGERPTASLEPFIELAMYYEHKEKSLKTALRYAELALDKLWQRNALKRSGRGGHARTGGRSGAEDKELAEGMALEKRIERLRRKAAAETERTRRSGTGTGSGRTKRKAEAAGQSVLQSVSQPDRGEGHEASFLQGAGGAVGRSGSPKRPKRIPRTPLSGCLPEQLSLPFEQNV